MRNLKKALSLSLALVMLLGMMVVGAGAASFTDVAKDSEKLEAIEVMKAIEVLQGYDDGKFHPDDTLTRAQAATIIAKAVMGPAVVEALNKTDVVCEFEDVNTTAKWAAPVIQACVNRGIIAGNGDGTFAPNATVTSEQFAAMLLRALDFDKTEYANNPNWAFNVRRDAIKAGLNANAVVVSATEMNRQDAAQMAFSAIQYSPSGEKAYSYNGKNYDSFFDAYLVASIKGADEVSKIQATTASDSLAKNFSLSTGFDTDVFGRTVATWEVKGEIVYTSTTPVGAAGSYVKATTLKADAFDMADEVAVYVNSAKKTETVTDADATVINDYTGNGVQVNVYKNSDGKVNKIVVVTPVLAQISNISEASKKVNLTVKSVNPDYGYGITSVKTVNEKNSCYATLAGMKKGDYVLITAADGVVVSVTEPTMLTGILSANDKNKTLTVGDTECPIAKVAPDNIDQTVDAKVEKVIYTDAAGNAYFSTGVGATDEIDVVYVTSVYTGLNSYNAITDMFQGVLTNGEVITGEYTDDSAIDAEEVQEAINDGKPAAFKYEPADNGKYKLTDAPGSATAIGIKKLSNGELDTSKKFVGLGLSSTHFAPDVKVVYVDGQQSTLTAQVKDGRQVVTVGTTTCAYAVISQDIDDNFVVSTVFVKEAPATANDAVIFVAAGQASTTNKTKLGADGKTRLYSYKVYVNGEEDTIWLKDKRTLSINTFYGYSVDEVTGAYVLSLPKVESSSITTQGVIAAGGVERFNGTYLIRYLSGANAAFKDYDLTGATVVNVSKTGLDVSNVEELRLVSNTEDVDIEMKVAMVANTEDKVILTVYFLDTGDMVVTGEKPVIDFNVTSDLVIEEGQTVTINGTIAKDAVITLTDETSALVINGPVAEGAQILVNDASLLENISGSSEIIASGKIKDVVRPVPSASETSLFSARSNNAYVLTSDTVRTMGVNVPVYAVYGEGAGNGDFNIEDNTVAVKWQYGDLDLASTVTEVTLKETISDGTRTCTFTNTKKVATDLTGTKLTMFCLTHPGDDEGNVAKWTGAGSYTDFSQSEGETLTVKVEVYNGTKLVKTLVWFSMPNPWAE